MVVEITQIGIQTLRWKFYIIWTVLNGSFVPFNYFLYPETAGRTLEDIDYYFRAQPSLLVFRDKVRTASLSFKVVLLIISLARHPVYKTDRIHREGRSRGAAQELRQPTCR